MLVSIFFLSLGFSWWQGFPRSDIDIPVVRAERHRLSGREFRLITLMNKPEIINNHENVVVFSMNY